MEKICGLCHQDCSDRPRVKDAQGRYFCRACAMARVARREAARADPPPENGSDPYAIDGAEPGAAPLPIEMLDYAEQHSQCPACMHSLAQGAKVCVSCGYHVEKGIQSSTRIEKSQGKGGRAYRCEHCGYDLMGLRDPICPECGKRINLSRSHRLNTGLKSQMLQEEYRKPAVWFAVGFVVVGIVLAIKGEPLGFLGYAILVAVQLPLMLIGLWICQKTFLGDIGTPLLNLVRLAGALALGNAVDEIIPISFFLLTPGLIVFWAVLMDLFEIDLGDAVITGIIMGVIKIAGALGIAYFLVSALGWSI